MSNSGRVRVVIRGRAYQLSGADAGHTQELARQVDQTMARFADDLVIADNYQLAILTALHLADELASVRAECDQYRARVGASADRLLHLLDGCLEEDPANPRDTEELRSGS